MFLLNYYDTKIIEIKQIHVLLYYALYYTCKFNNDILISAYWMVKIQFHGVSNITISLVRILLSSYISATRNNFRRC